MSRTPLYLHIGHAKAGSTTIQTALAEELEPLRAEGFRIADDRMQFSATGPLTGMPVQLIGELCTAHEAGLQRMVATIDAQARAGHFKNVRLVVSAESLTTPGAEYFAKALRHAYEIHVIYYVRRQDEWLPSAWNQWGCTEGLTLAQYVDRALARNQPNFRGCISRWQRHADTVRVRPLAAAALEGGDVVHDVLTAISSRHRPTASTRRNIGTDRALLEVFAQSPFLFEDLIDHRDHPGRNRVRRWLRDQLPADYVGEAPRLLPADRRRIMTHCHAENAALHREFFPAVDFEAVFGETADETTDAAVTPAESDRELAGLRRVIGLQFGIIHSLQERLAALEEQLRAGDDDR